MIAFGIIVCNFLVPFLNFHDNFICLIWIALNNIQSRNKNKWSLFWPMWVILQNFPLSTFLSVCCFNLFNDNDKGLKVYWQETKKNSEFCWWRLFSEVTPIAFLQLQMSLTQKYILPGINSYIKILEKSHTYTYLFLITEN